MSKIDEKKLIESLEHIAAYFQEMADRTLKTRKQIADLVQIGTIPQAQTTEIPNFFPDPYADMLRIQLRTTDGIGVYEVYPVKFLGTDNFKEISEIVRKLGGSYVHGDKAQGVKAHFTIPKGEPKP